MKQSWLTGLLAAFALAAQAQTPQPYTVKIGNISLVPAGFFDEIGEVRSATTTDSISTHFGSIPLVHTPDEALQSPRNSRLALRGDYDWRRIHFTGYYENDFLNFTPGETAWRWRQYWGQVQVGRWEFLAGQAWSLLRPNRKGIRSDNDLMNTDVIDPGYHVGLLGFRVRQFRLARTFGDNYKAAVAWETRGYWLAKAAMDGDFGHLELTALAGHQKSRGITVAGAIHVKPWLNYVTQEYWSKRAAAEALGVVPPGVSGGATLHGVEFHTSNRYEIYSYAGLVYAARSSGNRLVREATVGGDYRVPLPALHSGMLFSVQYSITDRYVWADGSGSMNFVMMRVRYAFN